MFTKDSRTENFLTQMGVAFEYRNGIRFHDLRGDWQAKNVARPKPVREDAVVEYAALMESGSAAPAPILRDLSGGLDVLDGVQRLSAEMLAGFSSFSSYVMTTTSEDTAATIRVLANARLQGRAEPAEWTRRRAIEVLVLGRGMTCEEVAKMGGWRVADVSRIAKAIDYQAAVIGIGGPELPDATLGVIAEHAAKEHLAKSPKLVANFLHLIKKGQFSHADAAPHIASFFSRASHSDYAVKLEEFRADPDVEVRLTGRKSPGLSPDVKLRREILAAITVLDEITEHGEELRNADEFFRLLKQLDAKLRKLAPRNQPPVSTRTPADMWVPST